MKFQKLKKYCKFMNKEYGVYVYKLNCLKFMDYLIKYYPKFQFDLIYADPPYFLSRESSNEGDKVLNAIASINKGSWDISKGTINDFNFNIQWISRCSKLIKKEGSIFISGTSHNIYSVGFAIQNLDMKILNSIVWYNPHPAPLLSCRTFKFDTELIIWAKNKKAKHTFNYELMKQINKSRQMGTLFEFSNAQPKEKKQGKHITQKPKALLERIILAASNEGDWIYDPFNGSATTGVVAINKKRHYVGTELDDNYIEVSKNRLNHAIFHNSMALK